MSLYLNTTTNELRELPASYIAELIAAGNPKAEQWQTAPPKPSENAAWQDGQWVTPFASTFTAETWLENQAFTPLRLLTCLDLEGKLRAINGISPKLAATRSWLDNLTLAAAINPDAVSSTWPPAPFAFDAVVQEAITQLKISK